jgi:hypothetical protein
VEWLRDFSTKEIDVRSGGGGLSLRGFLGTTVMAVVSIALIVYEWNFSRRRLAGEAVVMGSELADSRFAMGRIGMGRSGLVHNEVVYEVNGTRIEATIRTFHYHLPVGQSVPVLYLPNDPQAVDLDEFWQRHYGSVMALTSFMIFAVWETLNVLARHRRRISPLLSDNPAEDSDVSEILRGLEREGRFETAHRTPAVKYKIVKNDNGVTFVPFERST